jgi:hypothetical protein
MTKGQMNPLPLLKFSSALSRWPVEKNGPAWGSFPVIRVQGHELDQQCYGVEIEDGSMAPVLNKGMVAIFSQNVKNPALMNVFSIGRKGESPLVRKVVKNEITPKEIDNFTEEGRKRLRKSFMTPTPLHIPGSRVSPIAESTHQTIFFKSLLNPEKLTLVSKGNLLWLHPLVLILNQGEV